MDARNMPGLLKGADRQMKDSGGRASHRYMV